MRRMLLVERGTMGRFSFLKRRKRDPTTEKLESDLKKAKKDIERLTRHLKCATSVLSKIQSEAALLEIKKKTFRQEKTLVQIGAHVATRENFGNSVSLSVKGDSIIVGENSGLVRVYQSQTDINWHQFGHKITENDEYEIDASVVSLSGNGQMLAYGFPFACGEPGYVKIIEKESGSETKLSDSQSKRFGRSVILSQNGHRMAIISDASVKVYENKNGWNELGQVITSFDVESVALSGDGEIVAVGCYDDKYKNIVRIFKWKDSKWQQLGHDIVGESDDDQFGCTLDLSKNGKKVIIGTHGGNYVKVFGYKRGWNVIGSKITGDLADGGSFGYSVSITGEGDLIIIGSPNFCSDSLCSRGRARVYRFDQSEWKNIGDIMGEGRYDNTGNSVSISKNGDYVAVGAPGDGSSNGKVSVFKILTIPPFIKNDSTRHVA